MKRLFVVCFSFVLLGFSASAQNRAVTGFDKLKTLAGEWEGKDSEGNPLGMSYEIVSGGTAIMERIHNAHGENMVTLYHRDGTSLLATHYCSVGNQPRMRALVTSQGVKQLQFNFVSVSNLADPMAGHMRSLVVNFIDSDHFTQVWTYREKGKDGSSTFTLRRKK